MNSNAIHMVFSPQNCTLTLLEETLTHDRRQIAKQLLQQFRKDIGRKTASHTLIVGPRGSGKTHLLAFVKKSLEASAEIASELLIIPFAEEQHGLTTLLDFLVAAMCSCQHDLRLLDPDFGIGGRETALADAIKAFDKVAAGRAVLILLENLSSLFAALELGEVERLRAFLQSHPRVGLLASAVELFGDSARPDHPFHGFFSIEPLRPLNRKEARAYLAQLAKAKGDKDLEEQIQARGARPRIDAIYDLTGGNHRLLAMLSTFLTVDGFAELVGPFVQMVDRELTPYYQHRMDRLSPQQKKILMCITDHHGRALSVKEIAHHAFSTSQVVSRQLADLLHGAFVHRTKVGKESFYELNEPLLRLVLDIKEGHDRPLPLIVAFLRRWHALRELRQLEGLAPASVKSYYTMAIEETINLPNSITGESQASAGFSRSDFVAHEKGMHPGIEEISVSFSRAHALESNGEPEQAIAIYDEVIRRFGSSCQPELLEQVAKALVNKGIKLGTLKRFEEAIAVNDEVVRRLGGRDQPRLSRPVGIALVNKGAALESLNRSEEAIAAYDQVAGQFDSSGKSAVFEPVAWALVNKGLTFNRLNRSEEAIAVYDEVVRRFGLSDQPGLLERVAYALVNKGITLKKINRFEEAIAIYDEVVRRLGSGDQPDLLKHVATALVNKGDVLFTLKCFEEVISVSDEVVQRFGLSSQPELLRRVGQAIFNKGLALDELKRSEEAITAFDEIVRRFGTSDHPQLFLPVALALFKKGLTLGFLKRPEEAIAVNDEVVRRFGGSDHPQLFLPVAMALVNKGVALDTLNRREEAIASYDEVVRRFSSSEEPELLERVAWALVNKGLDLDDLKRSEEAITAFDEVVRRFGSSDQPKILEQVARALADKGFRLGAIQRFEEANAAYDEIVRRFGSSDQPELLKKVANALVNKGTPLTGLKRFEEVISVCDEVVRRFGSGDQPELLEQVVSALVNKGVTLNTLKRSEEANAVYDEVVKRVGSSDQSELSDPVARALAFKASLQFENGRLLEALELSERALSLVSSQPRALEIQIRTLLRVGKVTEALHILRNWLLNLDAANPLRSGLVTLVLEEAHGNVMALHELVEICRETPEPLSLGLLQWIQEQLPMSADRARALEKSEQMFVDSFGRLSECFVSLKVLSAVRQHALGHREALFRLPLEIRRLVVTQPD